MIRYDSSFNSERVTASYAPSKSWAGAQSLSLGVQQNSFDGNGQRTLDRTDTRTNRSSNSDQPRRKRLLMNNAAARLGVDHSVASRHLVKHERRESAT